MERLRGPELQALLDFLREIHAAEDLDTLRHRLPGAIATLVPADIAAYFEVDRRQQRVAVTPHPAGAMGLPEEQAFARCMHHYPLFGSYRRGKGSAVKISDFLSRREFQRLALYDELFRRVGMEHQMAKGLPGPPGLITGITLYRRGRDFGERDRLILNLVRPHLNDAYRRAAMITEMRAELNLVRQGFETIDRGLVVVDTTGRVRLITPRARQWVTEYFGPLPNGGLPDALRRWVEYDDARLADAATLATPRAPLIAEREGRRLDIRLVFDGDRRLLLLDEVRTTPDAQALERLGLSRRQAEVLGWIAEGKTNGEIATILGMSERTVEKHVEHILRKLGVETRTAAAVRALSVS